MKRISSVFLLSMLCLGLVVLPMQMKPAMAFTPGDEYAVLMVEPGIIVLSGGDSQVFSVVNTCPQAFVGLYPVSYQWYEYNASDNSWDPVIGETNSTFNFTAPTGYSNAYLSVAVTYNTGWVEDASDAWVQSPTISPYFSVEPVPKSPLANANASVNGLETYASQAIIGQNFTVEIHLMNATAINVPAGVAGVEVHFYFGNLLNYCRPVGFTTMLGQPGGALPGPVLFGLNGFYDDRGRGKPITDMPYTNATTYCVAAAAIGDASWNGNDGLVATITFQITAQPQQNQTDFYAPLQITFTDIDDLQMEYGPFIPFLAPREMPTFAVQGTLRIKAGPALVGDLNGDGKVGLDDLILLANAYNSKPGDLNWNALADIAPPYGIVSLADLVTMAMHYGQHYP